MVLDEPGRIVLHSWEKESDAILDVRRRTIENGIDSSEAIALLRYIEDRYKRLSIPMREFRPTLGLEAVLHLRVEPTNHIYIVRIADTIELLSQAYRDENRDLISDEVANLP